MESPGSNSSGIQDSPRPSAVYLQTVIDAIPDMAVVIDRNFRVIFANRAARRLAGAFDLAGNGLTCHQLLYGNDLDCQQAGHPCMCSEVIEFNRTVNAERRVRDVAGREIHVEISAAPIRDENGEVVQIIEVWRDITESKLAREALRESEQTYRVLFEESADATLIIDGNRFVDANDSAVKMLGYKNKAHLLRTHPSELSPPTQPDGRSSIEKANELMAMAFERGSHRFEWDHMRADGQVFPVEVLLTAIPVAGKRILHVVWRDITDRKQAEREREALIADLESQNAELERFTYTVSHDLKSPLITFTGHLGLLREDLAEGDGQAVAEDLRRMERATDRMAQLLDELLELSRIGRVVHRPESVRLEDLAHEAADLVRGQRTGREVQFDIQPDLPMIYGDRRRLLEVMQNLIDNAIKYMGSQPHPRIEVGTRRVGSDLVCYVQDNGVGIKPEYHERIFGLFNQLDQSFAGSGVGLALVKRIIEFHEGRVWVESKGIGQGSTFCFSLPAPSDASQSARIG